MAAPAENLLSLGYRTRTRENTFTKQREHCVKESRAMHLQQRLQELKDREHQAQRHNKQLLQQFEKAQDALEEMLARNAAMKTIRMEYERYLEENSPRWQQQLQEAAQKKRMEDCSRLNQKKSEEKEVLTSTVDGPLLSQDYHQSSFSHHPFSQLTSTQTHTGGFPGFLTVPHQSHSPFFFPPPNFLHPHSFLHPTSSLGQHQPWPKQEASGWDPSSWTAVIPPGSVDRLHTENPPPSSVSVREGNEMSGSTNTSKEKDGGGCLSPDLDVKPVRLSSSHAESSGSSGGSSLAVRDKRKKKKKRGRVQHSSSDSQKSSNKIIIASSAAARSSERNSSLEGSNRSSTRRGGEAPVGSPQPEGGTETRREEDGESQHSDEESSLSKKVENQSHDDKSESCREEESGRDVENQARAEEETDNQDGSSDEERDDEGETKDLETGDEENSQKSQEQVSDVEEEEDNEHQEDEEQLNKNKDTKIRKRSSGSSQDEEEDGSEEDEESNKDRSEEAEDSCDSDDIIISPQEKRSEQMQVIPEDDEDEVKTQSSDEDAIENLLAPPEGAKKAETDESADEEPKAVCHNMNIFQVMEDKSKVDRVSDSDEFDHFYD